MRKIAYKDFSLNIHSRGVASKRIVFAQLDLTYRCDFSCRHCYNICYGKSIYKEKELKTDEVKLILDKLYKNGVFWISFSGGDPLIRDDFLELYFYAKKKGFLIGILTNGWRIDENLINFFKKYPPFLIEITLNAFSAPTFKKIIQKDFKINRLLQTIKKLKKSGLPLKIKTQVTKDNFKEIPQIKNFLKDLGIKFYPSFLLYPRLNKDKFPCTLRLDGYFKKYLKNDFGCQKKVRTKKTLFTCNVLNTEGVQIDPFGNLFLCELIRKPKINLLKCSLRTAYNKALDFLKKIEAKYKNISVCASCKYQYKCLWCPAKAYLETSSFIKPIDYYCLLKKYEKNI